MSQECWAQIGTCRVTSPLCYANQVLTHKNKTTVKPWCWPEQQHWKLRLFPTCEYLLSSTQSAVITKKKAKAKKFKMGSLGLHQDFFVTTLKNNMPSTVVATDGGEVARILLAAALPTELILQLDYLSRSRQCAGLQSGRSRVRFSGPDQYSVS